MPRSYDLSVLTSYRMCPVGGKARQLLPDEHPLLRAAAWSKYDCAVTRRKDSEAHAVRRWAIMKHWLNLQASAEYWLQLLAEIHIVH